MSERREPTISSRVDTDDAMTGRVSAVPRATPAQPRPAVASSSFSPLAPFAVLLSLASLALGGFFYFQLTQFQQQAVQATAAQAAAEARIAELEKRLSATGETSEQSLAAIQAQLKSNSSEVAKLWDQSNQLKGRVAAVADEANTSVNTKIQAALKDNEGKLKQVVSEVQTEIKVLQDLMQAQQASVGRDEDSRKEQAARLAELSKRVKSVEAESEERLRNLENAIESIDAFRLQVNREIIKLKGGAEG
jgi:chromosome segregation ATPase